MKTSILEIIDIADITLQWRDWVYLFKVACQESARKNAKMSASNMRIGNMYTYRNLIYFEGKTIKYPTQTLEVIRNHNDIFFLN